MSTNITSCANCGKGEESSINLKSCAACKMVKYCSRDCQIAHRPKHKKECKKRSQELHDELLFKQPPQLEEDCPICLIRLPFQGSGQVYMACCGKVICCGCIHAVKSRSPPTKLPLCPFCRTPACTEEKLIERYTKRMEMKDAHAFNNMGTYYENGKYGLQKDYKKALELYLRAGELGSASGYHSTGYVYADGVGVEVDKKKARHYSELAAMEGHAIARSNLGIMEEESGNVGKAIKHYLISVEGGNKQALEIIKDLYMKGRATKDEYAIALRMYQTYLDEIKSKQRDEAAAFDADWKYLY